MNETMSTRGSNARGRATARAIESAVVRLATEHGAAALTVDQICTEAGIAQRTFFNHFDTKEDALLGKELPRIDEQRTREYLSSRSIGVLSGALHLVRIPAVDDVDQELLRARIAILRTSPALAERQAMRMLPLADEVQSIVKLKLKDLDPNRSDGELDTSAALITQMASALMLSSALPATDGSSPRTVHDLAWIWHRLL
ncbi:TetR family transcriptional regulator [Cryobacterium lactosi]|jgi:AcrR family transcriptional regulator|uniref:TetR family transcriptional regulator n=1 Tax=Cryobacterium lactosi TaxID=1259202 RepID=A0A4R9BLS4_9MICO|nr:TetR/AcrR family transcriptional regulator [Cryobacterium lactosi]TFD87012.1 TetR family transcriptional regulator [Cryobacterium lactosi]